MSAIEQAARAAKANLSADKPDETGFLGVLDDGTWPGTAASDGYLYDIPYHPGRVYARLIAGTSFEVGEVIQGQARRDPNRKIGFKRKAGALVGMGPDAMSATAGSGGDAPGDWVAEHTQPATTVTYDPAAPLTATDVQGALDEVAALLAPAALDADVDARLLELLTGARTMTRMTPMGVGGARRQPPVVLALLRWPFGARR